MASPAPSPYSARLRLPCAVHGIRTAHGAVTAIEYLPGSARTRAPADATAAQVVAQIERYLADPQYRFTLPLAHPGSAFQQRVRAALLQIPVGESRTYGEVARALRSSPRAVGRACGANPLALIVPCHRVVGSRGALGGFMQSAAGDPLAIKRWLLAHEGYRFGA